MELEKLAKTVRFDKVEKAAAKASSSTVITDSAPAVTKGDVTVEDVDEEAEVGEGGPEELTENTPEARVKVRCNARTCAHDSIFQRTFVNIVPFCEQLVIVSVAVITYSDLYTILRLRNVSPICRSTKSWLSRRRRRRTGPT